MEKQFSESTAVTRARVSVTQRLMAVLALAVLAFAVYSAVSHRTGILEGHISIGAQATGGKKGEPTSTPGVGDFAVREILILAQDGQTEVARVPIDRAGDFRVTLPVGTYLVDFSPMGADREISAPQFVEIASKNVAHLNVKIDVAFQ
jgi:hypothetical protein